MIEDQTLVNVEIVWDLGVILDKKLNFQNHVDCVVSKASIALDLMIRSLHASNRNVKYDTRAIIAAYCGNVCM